MVFSGPQWKLDMLRAMVDLLGRGYTPDYYEQAAQPFIDIAEGEINNTEAWCNEQIEDLERPLY